MKLTYNEMLAEQRALNASNGVSLDTAVRMQLQNPFKTGLEIAKYCAGIMRDDMADYDKDPSQYTQSLGCWHGFTAQQMMIAVKHNHQSTDKAYIYLSGWMVAAMRSKFGPLPDQSMHEKTAVPELVEEIYTFLKQADARELRHLFVELDRVREAGESDFNAMTLINNFQTHIVPIIADIDAGFGNEEATYLLAKKMIEAGACAIQIENQVSDAKQCGHQAGKVTVPHEVFLAKISAVRHAFVELGIPEGIIVARTDSLGATLTQQIPVSQTPGDIASQYCDFLSTSDPRNESGDLALQTNDLLIHTDTGIRKLDRLPNGLFQFKEGTEVDRVVLDCITSLQYGADLLWIETEKPNIEQIAGMVDRIREVVPNAKLVYNNSPSFNWTLAFREQVYNEWEAVGRDLERYPDPAVEPKGLMSEEYDDTWLGNEADVLILRFQEDSAERAGIFHHLITLPTYHETALGMDTLSEGYYGAMGMLAYVRDIQRKEIRRNMACVKHQDMAGSNIGDDHKAAFSGDNALLAGGTANTMNQF